MIDDPRTALPKGCVLVAPDVRAIPPGLAVPGVNAIVLEQGDGGALGGDLPSVSGLDRDLFREGERVEVDGTRGEVTLPGLTETHVVTAFICREDGRVLLLRRSNKVGSFQGRWAAVSGYLEDPTAREQVLREVSEETGLSSQDVTVEREGPPVYARGGTQIFVVHPFLLRSRRSDVRIDWEHTEFEWADPREIDRHLSVPKLDRAWAAVTQGSALRRKG